MENFNDGYTVDVPYDAHFFKELTPNYLRTLLLLQKIDLPERDANTPLHYLELGYGQGSSLVVHASSNEGEFWGTDFNPAHTLVAQKALRSAKARGRILNDSFAELAEKSRAGLLPSFDIIVLHGIWSWISTENQDYILDIVSHSLSAGGIVYISYNCMPGWANFTPVREFLNFHASAYNYSANTSTSKVQDAFALLKTLYEGGAQYFAANPAVENKITRMQQQSLSYIVHEYMNQSWNVQYFKDVAHQFSGAKCQFLSSARPLTQLPVAIPEKLQTTMAGTTDTILRETIRDFVHNTQFRCDLYVKGKNVLSDDVFLQRFNELSFALLCRPEDFSYKVQCPLAEVECKEEVYKPLVEYLAANDFKPKSVTNIRKQAAYKNLPLPNLVEVFTVLLGAGIIHPAQKASKKLQEQCNGLNTYLCTPSIHTVPLQFLASPVLGSAVFASQFEQAFLYARAQGQANPEEYVQATWKSYKEKGHNLTLEGKVLEEDDALKHLHGLAETFEKRLPLLEALGIKLVLPS